MTALKIFLVLMVVVIAFFSIVKGLIKPRTVEKEDGSQYGYYSDSNEAMRFILKIKPIVITVMLLVFIVMAGFSSAYYTNEKEIGFTSMFGYNTIIDGPGLHFKVPFLSEKHIYDATTQGMPIGFNEETNESMEADSMMITSDFNFVNVDFYIEYRITDPIEYCYGSKDPIGILKNVAQSAIRNTVGRYDVDSVMTTGRVEIESDVFADILATLESHHIGIAVTNVTLQDSEAPTTEVAKAFKDVGDAKTEAETAINSANSYRNTEIPAAEADAEQVKQDANAAKTERINAAKEEVARFDALYKEYANNPETVRSRLYYEALEEILPNMKVIIGSDSKVIVVQNENGNGVATTGNKTTSSSSAGTTKTSESDNLPFLPPSATD